MPVRLGVDNGSGNKLGSNVHTDEVRDWERMPISGEILYIGDPGERGVGLEKFSMERDRRMSIGDRRDSNRSLGGGCGRGGVAGKVGAVDDKEDAS